MDDLSFLRARIESYADYTNDIDRVHSDEQIRAYVGEALARLYERLSPQGAAGEAIDALLLRCEFADQRVMRELERDQLSPEQVADLRAADRELITLADRADAVALDDVSTFAAEIVGVFDRRLATIETGPPPAIPPMV